MLLSKMHYAIELAKLGHRVYFVNPPREGNSTALIETGAYVSGVQVLLMKPLKYALPLRHKLLPLYNLCMKRYAKAIRKIAGGHIDELWNFNPNSFPDMRAFGATKNLLLIFDFYKGRHVEQAAGAADIVLAPSQLILDHYKKNYRRGYFLQHGLGADFVNASQLSLDQLNIYQAGRVRKVGYTGNLLRQAMNIGVMQQIISDNPGIEFHIWGPYSQKENNVTDTNIPISNEWEAFIGFLKNVANVFLHGVTAAEDLAKAMQQMDAFLFVYSAGNDMNAASNSHKLLEYISTGKTVISSYVSTYEGTGLIEMCKDEAKLPLFFKQIIDNLEQYNAVEKQHERISYALNNSYAEQINRVQEYLYKA